MPSPTKPSKTQQNKPPVFKETIAAPMVHVPTLSGLSDSQLRYGIYGLWAVATIIAGVGIGMFLTSNRTVAAPAVSPMPIATTSLAVMSVPSAAIQVQKTDAALQNLQVTPDSSTSQAAAGTTQISLTTNQVQSSAGPTSLEPGYSAQNDLQGTVGTSPVE